MLTTDVAMDATAPTVTVPETAAGAAADGEDQLLCEVRLLPLIPRAPTPDPRFTDMQGEREAVQVSAVRDIYMQSEVLCGAQDSGWHRCPHRRLSLLM